MIRVSKVTIRLHRFNKFRGAIAGRSGRVRVALAEWTRIYARFIQRRFDRFSAGGGNWRRLRPKTIATKTRLGAADPEAILRRFDLLYNNLDPTLQSFQGVKSSKPLAVTVRFGGKAMYPDGTTVSDVIGFHNKGGGNLPKRQIIVQPDAPTKKLMAAEMKEALVDDWNHSA